MQWKNSSESDNNIIDIKLIIYVTNINYKNNLVYYTKHNIELIQTFLNLRVCVRNCNAITLQHYFCGTALSLALSLCLSFSLITKILSTVAVHKRTLVLSHTPLPPGKIKACIKVNLISYLEDLLSSISGGCCQHY